MAPCAMGGTSILDAHGLRILGSFTSSCRHEPPGRVVAAVPNSSTLLRACSGEQEGYESRDVFVVSLPELFLTFLHTRFAAQVLDDWLETEVIVRGTTHR